MKYAKQAVKKPEGTIKTEATGEFIQTYEGDLGYLKDAKSELFILGAHFMGEDNDVFYESGEERHIRFIHLVRKVTQEDPEWTKEFIHFLRHGAYMRTAPVVALAEYVKAKGPDAKELIGAVLRRADEPAELIGYWLAKYGKPIPMAIRRGAALALQRLDEYGAMKYSGTKNSVALADVIELTHVKPKTIIQSNLFQYLLDQRHHEDVRVSLENLPKIRQWKALQEIPKELRREYLLREGSEALLDAGMTWEKFSSWIPGGMDKEAWEFIIPSMPYMALLRNLRNFDEAGVSEEFVIKICRKLSDPVEVEKSMQFPFRFYTAFANLSTLRWGGALEEALNLSVKNIPSLPGKTLTMVDISKSMRSHYKKGAIFGIAQFLRSNGDLVVFGTDSKKVELKKNSSILLGVKQVSRIYDSSEVGGGTNTWQALKKNFDGHDRVIVVTDMQSHAYCSRTSLIRNKLKGKFIYNFNMVGYRASNMPVGQDGVYEFGGLTDITFRQIPMLEAGKNASWPWEAV
jgi:hypothetical protein